MTISGACRMAAWLGLSVLLGSTAGDAVAATYPSAPGDAAVGAVGTYVTRADDTLPDIARRFDLGYTELAAANIGVDPWLPGTGRRIILPTRYLLPDAPRRGIVVNLAARRLFYFPPGKAAVETFPIGVAVRGLDSPLGVTRVVAKQRNPVWIPPASIRAERPELPRRVPAGPNNPLGAFALVLGWPGYLIHGTNEPDGVGRNVSHGCLHLYPEDIARLYGEVAVGTPVRVLNEAAEVQWIGGELFVDVHPDKEQTDALDSGAAMPRALPPALVARVTSAAGDASGRVDWRAVERAGLERTGLPVPVTPPDQQAASRPPIGYN
jgi:L,D-transpeptidase ErfK/SrfK